ncbi:MAG: outer membrane protein transport protein [Acidobacteria bacterium]|nr:outer membrane protein transport protein [Acidobacteriota bacterium]
MLFRTVSVFVGLVGGLVWAGGLGSGTAGVSSTANGGAFVARAEDASALFINPAGLIRLDRQITFSVALSDQRSSYSTPGKSVWDSEGEQSAFPFLAYQDRIGKFSFAVGTAVTHSYGHEFEDDDFPGRFLATGMTFEAREHVLGVAYQLPSKISVGVGIRSVQADMNWSRRRLGAFDIGLDQPQLYEVREGFDGSDSATGFSFGLQYYKSRRLNFGLAYQSPVSLSFSGDHSFLQLTQTQIPAAAQRFGQQFQDGRFTSDFDLPAKISAGFTTRVTIRTRLELDVDWEDWSRIEQQRFDSETGSVVVDRQFRDVATFRVAGDFQQKKALLWRLALASSRSIADQNAIEPSFPDADRFHYSFGVSYTFEKLTLEAAYQYVQYRDRQVSDQEQLISLEEPDYLYDTLQNGLYETQRHYLNLGVRYRF